VPNFQFKVGHPKTNFIRVKACKGRQPDCGFLDTAWRIRNVMLRGVQHGFREIKRLRIPATGCFNLGLTGPFGKG
jgi:hypothetical protein